MYIVYLWYFQPPKDETCNDSVWVAWAPSARGFARQLGQRHLRTSKGWNGCAHASKDLQWRIANEPLCSKIHVPGLNDCGMLGIHLYCLASCHCISAVAARNFKPLRRKFSRFRTCWGQSLTRIFKSKGTLSHEAPVTPVSALSNYIKTVPQCPCGTWCELMSVNMEPPIVKACMPCSIMRESIRRQGSRQPKSRRQNTFTTWAAFKTSV